MSKPNFEAQDKAQKKHKPFAWMSRKFASLRTSNGSKSPNAPRKQAGRASAIKEESPSRAHEQTTSSSPASRLPPSDPHLRIDGAASSQNETDGYAPSPTQEHTPDGRPTASNKSAAPTLATNPETIHSEAGKSRAETANTAGGAVSTVSGGANSIFSSSNHSARSLTTTLTTIQSTQAPSQHLQQQNTATTPISATHTSQPSQSSTYFSHQYPTTPISALPAHLNPQQQQSSGSSSFIPTSYRSATANNLLSDNASILTLASSSHINNLRRNSSDTNASVRAIAPSSQWGGSRESLPLSVLSQAPEATTPTGNGPSFQQRQSGGIGLAPAERASAYSSGGVNAPVLSSERNSVYAARTGGGSIAGADAVSVKGQEDSRSTKSGHMGHGRNDSVAGSIGGLSSPLATTTSREPSIAP